MYARAVDDAGTRLRELRREEWQDLALAGLALGLALAATQRVPGLALPLFVGGIALGMLGIRALWRHWDIVDRLADEPDAYSISEVRAYAERQATMDQRRRFAKALRLRLESGFLAEDAAEIAALADELDDETLVLDPACGMACSRLVSDPTTSPLLTSLRRDDLPSTIRRVRSGFVRQLTDDT